MARITKAIKGSISRLTGRKNANNPDPEQTVATAEIRSCGSHFDEHQLFLDDLIRRYPLSNISGDHPANSKGTETYSQKRQK